ncbi:MAG: sel1 repeat family protein [Ruminococcaceae bacterium]|nr:sel1 repeat family protein [Oscillospiraceae bacterium]
MPKYNEISPCDTPLLDAAGEAVSLGDAAAILGRLKELYLNEENKKHGAALAIVEKYLFRAYEYLYFSSAETDTAAFFFDEEYHSRNLTETLAHLDREEGTKAFAKAIEAISALRYEEAGAQFRKSALLGDPNGAFNYGITLSRGDGVARDDLEASFWFWFASLQGHEKAMMTLALNYRKGEGVLRDGMNMIYWYLRAAIAGNNDGLLACASCLAQGIGMQNMQELGTKLLSAAMKMQDRNNVKFIGEALSGLREALEPFIYNK